MTSSTKRLKAHPVADLFPMLTDDEIKDMAADIAERGQLQPIMLHDGLILDGRNRYAACLGAGVEPRFETYEGDDPVGYALSVNLARRSLTKGQTAMIAARARSFIPLSGKDDLVKAAAAIGVGREQYRQAIVVQEWAPDLADSVVSGFGKLKDAHDTAVERRKDAQGEDAKLGELRSISPDLAHQVTEGELTLSDALDQAYENLEQQRRDAEYQATVARVDQIRNGDGAPAPSFEKRVADGGIAWSEAASLAEKWLGERTVSLDRERSRIRQLNEAWGVLRTVHDNPDSGYVKDMVAGLGKPDRDALAEHLSEVEKW